VFLLKLLDYSRPLPFRGGFRGAMARLSESIAESYLSQRKEVLVNLPCNVIQP
jgi:hypothetical protein